MNTGMVFSKLSYLSSFNFKDLKIKGNPLEDFLIQTIIYPINEVAG